MIYSKIVRGVSKEVIVNSTPQNVSELLIAASGGSVSWEPEGNVNRAVLSFSGVAPDPQIVARYTHDPDASPAIEGGKGKPVVSFDEIEITPDQKDALFVAESGDTKAWVELFDFEQQTL